MIQANELRIGNYFIYLIESVQQQFPDGSFKSVRDKGTAIGRVERIDKKFVSINGETCAIGLLQPITITEEILLNCGFEKYETGYSNDIGQNGELIDFYYGIQVGNQLHLQCNSSLTEFALAPEAWNGSGCECFANIKYLHQLQNLYFALTGKELKIKGL